MPSRERRGAHCPVFPCPGEACAAAVPLVTFVTRAGAVDLDTHVYRPPNDGTPSNAVTRCVAFEGRSSSR